VGRPDDVAIAGIVVRFVVFLVRGVAVFRADSGFSRI